MEGQAFSNGIWEPLFPARLALLEGQHSHGRNNNTLIEPQCKAVPRSITTKQKHHALNGKKALSGGTKSMTHAKQLICCDANYIWNDKTYYFHEC